MTSDGRVHIHGQEYKTVALRVALFRSKHSIADGWAIITSLVHSDSERVVFRAAILDPKGRETAVGYAEEKRAAKGINATSALENCETSAVGRALAAAGFGGVQPQEDTSRPASGREHHPSWTDSERRRFCAGLHDLGLGYKDVAAHCVHLQRPRPSQMTLQQRRSLYRWLQHEGGAEIVRTWLDEGVPSHEGAA